MPISSIRVIRSFKKLRQPIINLSVFAPWREVKESGCPIRVIRRQLRTRMPISSICVIRSFKKLRQPIINLSVFAPWREIKGVHPSFFADDRRRLNSTQINMALCSAWINSSRSTMKTSFHCSRLIGFLHYLCSLNRIFNQP